METIIFVGVIVILIIWGADRHLWVKEIEKDLKNYLGDVEVAGEVSEPPVRVHFNAQVFAIKTLIRKHFEL